MALGADLMVRRLPPPTVASTAALVEGWVLRWQVHVNGAPLLLNAPIVLLWSWRQCWLDYQTRLDLARCGEGVLLVLGAFQGVVCECVRVEIQRDLGTEIFGREEWSKAWWKGRRRGWDQEGIFHRMSISIMARGGVYSRMPWLKTRGRCSVWRAQ